jgi:hypothetical protein
MARPKSVDPKVVMTLRLPRSLVALIEADADWRMKLEAMISDRYRPKPASAPDGRRFAGVTALGEEIEKPTFVSRLKKR